MNTPANDFDRGLDEILRKFGNASIFANTIADKKHTRNIAINQILQLIADEMPKKKIALRRDMNRTVIRFEGYNQAVEDFKQRLGL